MTAAYEGGMEYPYWTFEKIRNYFIYQPQLIEPQGEARDKPWIYLQLAKRLGIGEKYKLKTSQCYMGAMA